MSARCLGSSHRCWGVEVLKIFSSSLLLIPYFTVFTVESFSENVKTCPAYTFKKSMCMGRKIVQIIFCNGIRSQNFFFFVYYFVYFLLENLISTINKKNKKKKSQFIRLEKLVIFFKKIIEEALKLWYNFLSWHGIMNGLRKIKGLFDFSLF